MGEEPNQPFLLHGAIPAVIVTHGEESYRTAATVYQKLDEWGLLSDYYRNRRAVAAVKMVNSQRHT